MSAAVGINASSLEDLGQGRTSLNSSSASFTVVQALVSLLTQGGWHTRLLQAQLTGDKGTYYLVFFFTFLFIVLPSSLLYSH